MGKISTYPALSALSADDLLVARTPQQFRLNKVTAATLATYIRTVVAPTYMLTTGSNRLLKESGELLLLEAYNGTSQLLHNLDELTDPAFEDVLVLVESLSGATSAVRMSELVAYLVVVSALPANATPHLLTEAGDTLVSEAGEPIEVE